MSGLIALLDDVAGIAKVAAASVDDVASMSVKASAKAAGAVIDDAAVTPKYVHGFDAGRELPIIWKIARGSIFNKLVILLPMALALSAFAPWAIAPLLMVGGAYLCFEGAEKVWHSISPGAHHHDEDAGAGNGDPTHLEEEKVRGAIKTDFILSAEIMTIALAALPPGHGLAMQAAALALAGLLITVAVYGVVALIVKMDDIGLALARRQPSGPVHAFGRGLVRMMPRLMAVLSVVGTAAMIWVGGSIVIHGLHELGLHQPYQIIHDIAHAAGAALPDMQAAAVWAVTAFYDGIFGLALGLALIPVATRLIAPAFAALARKG